METLLAEVYGALDNDWLRAANLADKGAWQAQHTGDDERHRLFQALALYAHACEVWDTCWDFEKVIELLKKAEEAAAGPAHATLRAFLQAERLAVTCEQAMLRYELQTALQHSRASLEALRLAQKMHQPHDLPLELIQRRLHFEDSVFHYLEAYRALLHGSPRRVEMARAAIRRLNQTARALENNKSIGEAQEVRAYRQSLELRLQLERDRRHALQLEDLQVTWTFRRRCTHPGLAVLFNQYLTDEDLPATDYSHRAQLEQLCPLPLKYVGRAALNDIFVTDIGRNFFAYADFVLPDFEIRPALAAPLLTIQPAVRLYAIGVASVRFRTHLEGAWDVPAVQYLRLLGSDQIPARPDLAIDWLSDQPFCSLKEAGEEILNRLTLLLDRLHPPGEKGKSAEAEWAAHTLIQVDTINLPPGFLTSPHSCELAALSQPLLETQDSLDAWMRLRYKPTDNLATPLNLGAGALFFITGDHILFHAPAAADWVQAEYLDLVEFVLNASTLLLGYMPEMRAEVNGLREESRSLREYLRDRENRGRAGRRARQRFSLKQFTERRVSDIARLNHARSQMLTIRNVARASDVTRYNEHRLLLEHAARAVNLEGTLGQAETLITALTSAHQDLDDIGRLLQQQRMEEQERQRRNFESVLTIMLQILGLSQVISSVVSILTIQEDAQIAIPWLQTIISGARLKWLSGLAMLGGLALLAGTWIVAIVRARLQRRHE